MKQTNILIVIEAVISWCKQKQPQEFQYYKNISNLMYDIKKSALNVQSKAFSRVGVKIWNGIPTSLKNSSKNSFKKSIRTRLIEILETENSYVDIDTLINEMKD